MAGVRGPEGRDATYNTPPGASQKGSGGVSGDPLAMSRVVGSSIKTEVLGASRPWVLDEVENGRDRHGAGER